jgi:hypothetical protein
MPMITVNGSPQAALGGPGVVPVGHTVVTIALRGNYPNAILLPSLDDRGDRTRKQPSAALRAPVAVIAANDVTGRGH